MKYEPIQAKIFFLPIVNSGSRLIITGGSDMVWMLPFSNQASSKMECDCILSDRTIFVKKSPNDNNSHTNTHRYNEGPYVVYEANETESTYQPKPSRQMPKRLLHNLPQRFPTLRVALTKAHPVAHKLSIVYADNFQKTVRAYRKLNMGAISAQEWVMVQTAAAS